MTVQKFRFFEISLFFLKLQTHQNMNFQKIGRIFTDFGGFPWISLEFSENPGFGGFVTSNK